MSKEPAAAAPGLLRALGPWTATAVVVGTVIGSGVFKKPQLVAENVPFIRHGSARLDPWRFAGFARFLAYAEIVVLYPKAGGIRLSPRRLRPARGLSFGAGRILDHSRASLAALATIFPNRLGTSCATRRVISFLDSIAAALPSLLSPTSTTDLAGNEMRFWAQRGMTVFVILMLGLVNVRGVRWGGLLQLFINNGQGRFAVGIMVAARGRALRRGIRRRDAGAARARICRPPGRRILPNSISRDLGPRWSASCSRITVG